MVKNVIHTQRRKKKRKGKREVVIQTYPEMVSNHAGIPAAFLDG